MAWEIAIAIILLGTAALFYLLATGLKDEHAPIKFFYFFTCLWFIIISIYFGRNLMTTQLLNMSANESIIQVYDMTTIAMYPVIVMTMTWFLVYFIQKLIIFIRIKVKK